jgi:competence protein ComGC
MKKLLVVLSVIAMLSLLTSPALASEDMTCEHSGTTMDPLHAIASLHHCVMHAYDMGHITNAGVANSLMAKLDAAQAAFDRGQTDVAVNLLNAFINEVGAQSGKFIVADHAGHLVMHARMVILALGG